MPSPPASPYSSAGSSISSKGNNYSHSHSNSNTVAPSVHPLIRAPASPNTAPTLLYNVLTHPDHAQLVHTALYASSDLAAPATHPPTPALRVRVVSYPGGIHTIGAAAPLIDGSIRAVPNSLGLLSLSGLPGLSLHDPLAYGWVDGGVHDSLIEVDNQGEFP